MSMTFLLTASVTERVAYYSYSSLRIYRSIKHFSSSQENMPSSSLMEYSAKKESARAPPHVLVLPFPVQGHINPMLQFAKRLASTPGVFRVTLATTVFLAKTTHVELTGGLVRLDTISDGYDRGGFPEAGNPEAYHRRLDEVGPRTLAELIERQKRSDSPFTCLVYDTSLHWALDVAKGLGLTGIAFNTQSCAAFAIYYYVYRGLFKVPSEEGVTVSLPGLPPLAMADVPSLLFETGSCYQPVLSLKTNQFCNLDKADWVLFNSTEELESQAVSLLKGLWRVKTIGPTLPFTYLDGEEDEDKDYGYNCYKPSSTNYMEWLDSKPEGSVAYVSFGSIAATTEKQMEELAWGLRDSGVHFLWVVRSWEQHKLPDGFAAQYLTNEIKGRGLLVSWCNQLQVLAHGATGCFVTHCGWNSVLEALSLGVPMVGVPQWTDQPTNAKYVEDVWGVGVRARADEEGVVRREEMETCVKEVMEGSKGKEIRKNACKWRERVKGAVREGGSSVKNMQDFVGELVNGTTTTAAAAAANTDFDSKGRKIEE